MEAAKRSSRGIRRREEGGSLEEQGASVAGLAASAHPPGNRNAKPEAMGAERRSSRGAWKRRGSRARRGEMALPKRVMAASQRMASARTPPPRPRKNRSMGG